MKTGQILLNGLIKENPTFVMLLGMCPPLGVTTSAINGLGMGLATTAVLMMSNVVISSVKQYIPQQVRIPCYIVVIAAFVTIVDLLMAAYVQSIHARLGIFIPLIVVNCLVLGRAEMFAARNTIINSMWDGLGMGLGFTAALTLIGSVREILGSGTFLGVPLVNGDANTLLLFIMPPGAFISLGLIVAFINKIKKLVANAANAKSLNKQEAA